MKTISSQKLAIYVNQVIPINETYRDNDYSQVKSHCVIVTGIKQIDGVKCLVLENNGGHEPMKYIPVDFPFFEDVINKLQKIEIENHNDPSNIRKKLNNYGLALAQKKWKSLRKDKNWYAEENDNGELKYQMFFVRGSCPIYKLEFSH